MCRLGAARRFFDDCLRRHYALTLDVWGSRFDRNWQRIQALDRQRFDERFRAYAATLRRYLGPEHRGALCRAHSARTRSLIASAAAAACRQYSARAYR
ncbi:MAG: hypothetical protein EPO20_07905 [Betaproteobacteria bacterium]|nr:MAG: hypothetical protein EPO20_07905 [Betaproteobacteria bacterium]